MEKTCAKFQKDRYKIVWGVALTSTHCLHTEVEKWLNSQSGKSDELEMCPKYTDDPTLRFG